jgi:hypothetical protein
MTVLLIRRFSASDHSKTGSKFLANLDRFIIKIFFNDAFLIKQFRLVTIRKRDTFFPVFELLGIQMPGTSPN